MAAHSHVIDDINKMADEMIASDHGKTPTVKKRRAEINDKYTFMLNYSFTHEPLPVILLMIATIDDGDL